MIHHPMTMMWYFRLLESCTSLLKPTSDTVVLSWVVVLFIEIEKAAMTGCFKIIWR
jgi:hypothetical protein